MGSGNTFLLCPVDLGRMISIKYVPLSFRKSTRRRRPRGKTGQKEKERKKIEIIGRYTNVRSTEIMRTEINTKNKAWEWTLRRIVNMAIESQEKEDRMKQSKI
jgi:hypothetical protein